MPSRCFSTGMRLSAATRSISDFPAARDDDVDQIVQTQQDPDSGAILRRHQLDRVHRQPRRGKPLVVAARMAREEWADSLPPRRIAAFPALRHKAAASAVTLGRLS